MHMSAWVALYLTDHRHFVCSCHEEACGDGFKELLKSLALVGSVPVKSFPEGEYHIIRCKLMTLELA
jgi:hypothetical protein